MTTLPVPWARTRLSGMMLLQFAIWGAWAPVLGVHLGNLGFSGADIGAVYGTAALATILAPMIAGQIADRWLSTERFLALCFLSTGVLLLLARQVDAGDPGKVSKMWWLAFAGFFFFGPTLGLANALAFSHVRDSRRDFPLVRMLGTIGWIAAGVILSAWMRSRGSRADIGDCLSVGAVFAFLSAAYSLTLPHTPPKRQGVEWFAAGRAFRMLKDPSFALLMVLAFVLLLFATMYYTFGGNFFKAAGIAEKDIPLVLGIGQAAEILAMLALPFVYRRLGAKGTIAVGVAAWTARFALYAVGTPAALLYAAQALHGVCFAFSIAAAMIYVEQVCPADIRASAQSLLGVVTYGLGMFAGSHLGGRLTQRAGIGTPAADWSQVWWVAAGGCACVLVAFLAGFRDRTRPTPPEPAREPALEPVGAAR